MTKEQANKLADVLERECCIEGIRGPSGKFNTAKDQDALHTAIVRLILRTMTDLTNESNKKEGL